MKVSDLAQLSKIASRISNQGSLTSLYRAIELGPESIRVCSEFGNMELSIEPTGLTKEVLLDCAAVQTVANSLPLSSEISFTEKDNKVSWKCGEDKGHWSTVVTEHSIPRVDHTNFPWTPPSNLGDALNLATCACQAAAVSIGLYGISIITDGDKLRLLSSNTVSLAESVIDKGTFPVERLTLRPPVPSIIAALLSVCPSAQLDVTDKGLFIGGPGLVAHLPISNPLDMDLKKVADKFRTATQVAKVNMLAIRQFINRARGLSDKHTEFTISLGVKEGKIGLMHSGISSSTERFLVADGADHSLSYESEPFPAAMILIALSFVEDVVFDYMKDKQIVMRGTNPQFNYVIGGA